VNERDSNSEGSSLINSHYTILPNSSVVTNRLMWKHDLDTAERCCTNETVIKDSTKVGIRINRGVRHCQVDE